MEREEKDKVSWNIAEAQAKTVSNLISRAIRCYLKGDLSGQYFSYVALADFLYYALDDDEIKKLDIMELEISPLIEKWNMYHSNYDGENTDLKSVKKEFQSMIKKYQRVISKIVDGLGYFPTKPDERYLGRR